MKSLDRQFTVSIFTENTIGMLNRITIIFTRRHLNIDSITASETEIKNVHRYTIVLQTTREQIEKVVGQIEKLIDVLKAFVHEDDEVVHQEIALYKIKTTELAIIPIQDYLCLGNEARMNAPSTLGDNWKWRMQKGQLGQHELECMRYLASVFDRERK